MINAAPKTSKLLEHFWGGDMYSLPVIHAADERKSLREAPIAREAGCDGMLLINHRTRTVSRRHRDQQKWSEFDPANMKALVRPFRAEQP
jgi:hypothetical protein